MRQSVLVPRFQGYASFPPATSLAKTANTSFPYAKAHNGAIRSTGLVVICVRYSTASHRKCVITGVLILPCGNGLEAERLFKGRNRPLPLDLRRPSTLAFQLDLVLP